MYIIIVAVYIACTIILYVNYSRNVDRIKNIYEDINKDQEKKIQNLEEENKELSTKNTLLSEGYEYIPPSKTGYSRWRTDERFAYYEIDYGTATIYRFSDVASVVANKKDIFASHEDAKDKLRRHLEERHKNIKELGITDKENDETKKTNKA